MVRMLVLAVIVDVLAVAFHPVYPCLMVLIPIQDILIDTLFVGWREPSKHEPVLLVNNSQQTLEVVQAPDQDCQMVMHSLFYSL